MNRQENKDNEAVSVRLLISISCCVRRGVRITEAKHTMGVKGICGSLVSGIVRRSGTYVYPDILTRPALASERCNSKRSAYRKRDKKENKKKNERNM